MPFNRQFCSEKNKVNRKEASIFDLQDKRLTMKLDTLTYCAFILLLIQACAPEKSTSNKLTPEERLNAKMVPSEELFLQRAYPDDYFDIKVLTNAMAEARQLALLKTDIPGFDADWTVRGPGNIGARVNTVAVHPTNEDIMLAGFSQGGIFKTADGGANWYPVFDDQAFLSIGHIAFDPSDPQTVYVGTGDPNISGYPFIGDGVYKSTDGGESWTHLGLSAQRIVSKIIVHPTNSNIVYVGCMGLPFERNNDRGLYKTENGGLTWDQVLFLADEAGVIDMVMHPDEPETLFVAAWDRIRNNQESYIQGTNGGVYKTTDGGQNWAKLGGGLPEGEVCRIGLAISGDDPNKVWAMMADTNNYQLKNIYRTDDAGANWLSLIDDIQQSGLSDNALGGFGWYFGKLRVNPNDNNDLFLLGVDLWRSIDGGTSWFRSTPPWWQYSVHADKHDLIYTPNNNIILATDGGLYKTDIDAQEWSDIEDIPTTQFYRVAYNPHTPDVYYGGAQDNGTSGGSNLEEDWARIYGGDGFQAAFNPEFDFVWYVETQNGNIVLTFDGGQTWEDGTNGLDFGERRNWDMQYILSPHNSFVMYTGTIRPYKSIDGGYNWVSIGPDLTDGEASMFRTPSITTLSESPLEAGLLYYGTVDANVWRTENDGASWTDITGDLPNRYITDIKASPSQEDWVYVTLSGYKDNDFSPRVFRSTDRGTNWEAIAGDLPNLAINDIYILPEHQDSILFVATDGGVYGSTNSGESWDRLGANMPFIPVYDLEWNVANNELIAGTHARSIMTYPIDTILNATETAVAEIPVVASSVKLWPSPAKSKVDLQFELKSGISTYAVRLLDQHGQVLQQIKERNTAKGLIQHNFTLQNLPSGTYLLSIQAGKAVYSKAFVKI